MKKFLPVALVLGCADQVEVGPQASPAPPPRVEPELSVAPPEQPRFSQEELQGRPDTVALSGELRCSEGRFQLRVYPPAVDEDNGPRRFDSFPSSGFLAAVEVSPGPFQVLAPKGPARLLLAWEDRDQDGHPSLEEPPFFADPHGQPFDLEQDRDGLVLDCRVPPTEPESSRVMRWEPDPGPRRTADIQALLEEAGADEPVDLGARLEGGPQ